MQRSWDYLVWRSYCYLKENYGQCEENQYLARTIGPENICDNRRHYLLSNSRLGTILGPFQCKTAQNTSKEIKAYQTRKSLKFKMLNPILIHIKELAKRPFSDGWFSAIKPGFDSPYRYQDCKRLSISLIDRWGYVADWFQSNSPTIAASLRRSSSQRFQLREWRCEASSQLTDMYKAPVWHTMSNQAKIIIPQ